MLMMEIMLSNLDKIGIIKNNNLYNSNNENNNYLNEQNFNINNANVNKPNFKIELFHWIELEKENKKKKILFIEMVLKYNINEN